LGTLGTLLYSAGEDLIRGLINGIKGMAGDAARAARDAVAGAVNSAKGFLGISSPSRVFMEIGEQTTEGLIHGLRAVR
jgi:phage-related protein